ncbi:hypothetical protein E4U42_002338 [Claviceps africana]|uniref:Phosphoglycerate mutase family protein n=1 Tax=Claviceps africana TaxID=83212 RepID=A0A8K0J8D2_9HYPO|nr:hypothetical protein E4U42_002338 [Claviceps africana]
MSNSPPAHLFVVRHGSRLDAADKSWHLTSPTPYDPPLTYGGFLQARQVGNEIANILEQARADDESSRSFGAPPKRKRYKIVIHSSPFLRCVQTSVAISSGLAQTFPHSVCCPQDLIVPRAPPQIEPRFQFKSTLLRLDSFLGEWLSPEYFENITPPPGPALMLGGAKAELLRREDYTIYADSPEPEPPRPSSVSLWQSPLTSPVQGPSSPWTESEASGSASTLGQAPSEQRADERKRGYTAPRPIHAVSSSGSIPEGFVAHARDASVVVDYQWDSMRPPLDFGDGGKFGEEWASMHKRFRRGVRRLVNWYASTGSAADNIAKAAVHGHEAHQASENDVTETVVIMVSHGAGCNALIGAITHQPVLMDIGIASITMASRKPNLDYGALLSSASAPSGPLKKKKVMVPVDKLYDIRLSASTEHLRRSSTVTTPSSARSISTAAATATATAGGTGFWSTSTGSRGRTSTLGGPVMSPFTYSDPFSSTGSRSTSASAALPPVMRRESAPLRTHPPRGPALATVGLGNGTGPLSPGTRSPTTTAGLWSARPSNLRLVDDGSGETDGLSPVLPDFDQKKFHMQEKPATDKASASPGPGSAEPVVSASSPTTDDAPRFPDFSPPATNDGEDNPDQEPTQTSPPLFAGPIKLRTNLGPDKPAVEELKTRQLGGGLGGLWGVPPVVGEADRFRDRTHTKRRWTVNERA